MVERDIRPLDEPLVNEEFGQLVARIPDSVPVVVALIWIGDRAVVARVARTVLVCILLAGISIPSVVFNRSGLSPR